MVSRKIALCSMDFHSLIIPEPYTLPSYVHYFSPFMLKSFGVPPVTAGGRRDPYGLMDESMCLATLYSVGVRSSLESDWWVYGSRLTGVIIVFNLRPACSCSRACDAWKVSYV